MTDNQKEDLGKTLWGIADMLRGSMSADDFRDYMLSFLFLRYISDNYEDAVKKELEEDYPTISGDSSTPLQRFYEDNPDDIEDFEDMMRRQVHYVIPPAYLWGHIALLARHQDKSLLKTLQAGFKHIEEDSFESTFKGLFSEINLESEKLGKDYTNRNEKLCGGITKIAEGLSKFSMNKDTIGDAYEYLIGKFAAGGARKPANFTHHNPFLRFFRKL